MSKVQMLRALVKQRLTAAAEEIFGLFERTIAEYEEELSRSKEENERQRRLLDAVFSPQLRLHRAVSTDVQQLLITKEELPAEQQEWSSSLDQEDPEPPHIKEEQEELWTSQEGEQLQGVEEADITKFTFSPIPVKSEDDGKKPQSSQLHQRLSEQMETETEDDGEDCGGPEPARSSDPDSHLQPATHDSGDWEETKEPCSGLNLLQVNSTFDSVSTTAIRRFSFTPEIPLHELPRNRPLSASPATDEKKLLAAMTGLSRQVTQFAAEVKPQFAAVNSRLLSMEEKMAALEAKANCSPSVEDLKRKRRAHNPKIAETVRRLHNSKANCRRYDPEQGMTSPHNQAVTSYLVEALAASSDLNSVDNDVILSACKTYYETVRRNFRYSQPDLAAQAAAQKTSARSRQRRKRLLEARQSVLIADDVAFWNGVTIDMMSDEEDGTFDEVSGWIVRPPSFRSPELTSLCAKLQARLEANPKYTATHHRRLHTGPDSDRMPPNTYDSEAAKRHFKAHLIPKIQL